MTGIASSVKTVDGVVGKILVAKHTFDDYQTKLGNQVWHVKVGTVVYALMEGTRQDPNGWRRTMTRKTIKVIYNGMPGEILVDDSFDHNWAITDPDERLKDKTFVFTGALSNTREYFKTLVECFGGTFGAAVTGRTSYLVVGDTTFQGDANHKSTKAKKAASMGVPVINETGFLNMVNK